MLSIFNSYYKLNKKMRLLVKKFEKLNISHSSLVIINEYLEVNEYGLSFEHLLYEIYENDIKISKELYDDIIELKDFMGMDESEYSYIKDLVFES